MIHTFTSQRSLRTAVAGLLIGLVMVPAVIVAPSAQAAHAQRSAAAVTTSSIAYNFEAQIVHGPKAGMTVHGWLSGTQDSTGVLTATLTADGLTPLTPGCGAHVEFGPPCPLPASANVSGQTMGSGSSAIASITAVGKGWTWILAGAAVGTTGEWTGTLTQGSSYMGTWSLTPQAMGFHIDMGARSDAKSKDKLVISAAIDLHVTADGWAVGTFAPYAGGAQTIVTGYVNTDRGSASIDIPMGKMGTVLATGWTRKGFGNLRFTGSFVGPAAGDYGTWSGQGG